MNFKRILSLLLVFTLSFTLLFGCTKDDGNKTDPDKVLSYQEFVGKALNEQVVIRGYVQDKADFYENGEKSNTSLYLRDDNGAYYAYRVYLTKEDFDKIQIGSLVEVKGTKSEWNGEVEIAEGCTCKLLEGDKKTYPAVDLSDKLADAKDYINQLVSIKGMTVVGYGDEGLPFSYTYGGGGDRGSDLYLNLAKDGKTYLFVVESSIRNENTDVYNAVEALELGETVDVEGYAYFYNGLQLQLTKVEGKKDVMSYFDYEDAEKGAIVTVAGFISGLQKYSSGYSNTTFYLANSDGGYFVYRLSCTQEEYDNLKVGKLVKITGPKSEWKGEVEINCDGKVLNQDIFYTVYDTNVTYEATPINITSADEYMNELVKVEGAIVVSYDDEVETAFSYGPEGGLERGADLYFKVEVDGLRYTFVVESDLCNEDTDVYKAVEALKVGDVIDITGFAYFYNTIQLQVTEIAASK